MGCASNGVDEVATASSGVPLQPPPLCPPLSPSRTPIQMRPPIHNQPPLEILPDPKLLVLDAFLAKPLQHTHPRILVRAEEKRHAVPLLAAPIPHPVHRTRPRPARDELQKVRNVDDERVRLVFDGHPDAVAVEHLERRVRRLALAHEREPAKVGVGADADVRVGELGRVVHGADVGHGVGGDGVEVGFGEGEGEREDGEEAAREGEHGGVVGVEGGAEEGC